MRRRSGLPWPSGVRGGAQYALAASLNPPTARALTPVDLESTIMNLARSGTISNEQVRDATGLDRAAVVRTLNAMVAAGTLVREGERRATRYRLAAPDAS